MPLNSLISAITPLRFFREFPKSARGLSGTIPWSHGRWVSGYQPHSRTDAGISVEWSQRFMVGDISIHLPFPSGRSPNFQWKFNAMRRIIKKASWFSSRKISVVQKCCLQPMMFFARLMDQEVGEINYDNMHQLVFANTKLTQSRQQGRLFPTIRTIVKWGGRGPNRIETNRWNAWSSRKSLTSIKRKV